MIDTVCCISQSAVAKPNCACMYIVDAPRAGWQVLVFSNPALFSKCIVDVGPGDHSNTRDKCVSVPCPVWVALN